MYCGKCGNRIDPNGKFCNKCGSPINNQQNITSTPNNTYSSPINNYQYAQNVNYHQQYQIVKNNNNKMIFAGIGIGLCFVLVLVLIMYFSGSSSDYYFNEEPQETENNVVTTTETTTTKKGKYDTVIIYDNVYTGVKISNDIDAYNLIEKDSVEQKNKCPKEIKQIEEEFISRFNITAVNLCEMDIDFARELETVFEKIYTDYPSVRGYITNLTLVNVSMNDNYIAAFMPIFNFALSDSESTYPWVIKTQVLLNTSYFLNKDRLKSSVTDGSKTGHFPKNASIYSPVAHELGHYLSFLAMMRNYKLSSILLVNSNNVTDFYKVQRDFGTGDYSLSMIKEAYNNYIKDTNDKIEFDAWRGTISNYALAKDNRGEYIYDETIAESFHDVYLNGDAASKASKYVVAVLKEKLGN